LYYLFRLILLCSLTFIWWIYELLWQKWWFCGQFLVFNKLVVKNINGECLVIQSPYMPTGWVWRDEIQWRGKAFQVSPCLVHASITWSQHSTWLIYIAKSFLLINALIASNENKRQNDKHNNEKKKSLIFCQQIMAVVSSVVGWHLNFARLETYLNIFFDHFITGSEVAWCFYPYILPESLNIWF